jgi:hypothetical protein
MILLNPGLKSRNARLSAHQDSVIEREADLISRDPGLIRHDHNWFGPLV